MPPDSSKSLAVSIEGTDSYGAWRRLYRLHIDPRGEDYAEVRVTPIPPDTTSSVNADFHGSYSTPEGHIFRFEREMREGGDPVRFGVSREREA